MCMSKLTLTDEEEDVEAHQRHLQELIMRTTQQDKDIQELKRELQKLKEDLNGAEADTISPEQNA